MWGRSYKKIYSTPIFYIINIYFRIMALSYFLIIILSICVWKFFKSMKFFKTRDHETNIQQIILQNFCKISFTQLHEILY